MDEEIQQVFISFWVEDMKPISRAQIKELIPTPPSQIRVPNSLSSCAAQLSHQSAVTRCCERAVDTDSHHIEGKSLDRGLADQLYQRGTCTVQDGNSIDATKVG